MPGRGACSVISGRDAARRASSATRCATRCSPAIHNAGVRGGSGSTGSYVAFEVRRRARRRRARAARDARARRAERHDAAQGDAAPGVRRADAGRGRARASTPSWSAPTARCLGDSTDGEGFLRVPRRRRPRSRPAGRCWCSAPAARRARSPRRSSGVGAHVEVAARRREAASTRSSPRCPGSSRPRGRDGPAAAEIVVNATPIGMGDRHRAARRAARPTSGWSTSCTTRSRPHCWPRARADGRTDRRRARDARAPGRARLRAVDRRRRPPRRDARRRQHGLTGGGGVFRGTLR